ncbi:MAG: hypothetical protein U0169_27365 [Polyangiaceae bacterium]
MSKDDWPREKNWKLVYTRSAKLARAKQLGFGYPKDSVERESEGHAPRLHVLFVCSRNQLRSPTAERVWRKHPALEVRSAGTSTSARRPVTAEDVRWADVIFVMEEKHRTRLVAEFTRLLAHKTMHVLDVPDDYAFMDPELVTEVTESVAAILDLDPP